jgi:hypothetical protein
MARELFGAPPLTPKLPARVATPIVSIHLALRNLPPFLLKKEKQRMKRQR